MDVPGDAFTLWMFLILVLPGLVWSGVRVWSRGRALQDKELSSAIVAALVTSTLFDSLYLLLLGDSVVDRATRIASGDFSHARALSGALLILAVVIPGVTSLAWNGAIGWRIRPTWGIPIPMPFNKSPYEATPTAWDKALPNKGGHWIRIRRSDGTWIGGWYADNSFVSSYPESRDLYVEDQHCMGDDGSFGDPVAASAGFWIAVQDDDIVEFIKP